MSKWWGILKPLLKLFAYKRRLLPKEENLLPCIQFQFAVTKKTIIAKCVSMTESKRLVQTTNLSKKPITFILCTRKDKSRQVVIKQIG